MILRATGSFQRITPQWRIRHVLLDRSTGTETPIVPRVRGRFAWPRRRAWILLQFSDRTPFCSRRQSLRPPCFVRRKHSAGYRKAWVNDAERMRRARWCT